MEDLVVCAMGLLRNGTYSEAEPFPEGIVIIGRNSLIDACKWRFGAIKEVNIDVLYV